LRQSGEQQRNLKDLSQFVREEPLPKFSFGLLTSLLNGRQIDLSRRLKPFRGGGEGGNVGVLERGFNVSRFFLIFKGVIRWEVLGWTNFADAPQVFKIYKNQNFVSGGSQGGKNFSAQNFWRQRLFRPTPFSNFLLFLISWG